MDLEAIDRAADIVRGARHVIALTGAGISVPSGIPDFRSDDGLWRHDDPMDVASLRAFCVDPGRFYDWFRPLLDRLQAAQPNPAHLALAALERAGMLKALITQNIDGLHQRALETCDALIVAGTALEVAPACEMPLAALRHGAHLIIVNRSETYLDE